MTRIIMHGCNGHMGRVICDIVSKDKDCEIAAGIDIVESNAPFPTFTNINDCCVEADVIIDFSTAGAVPAVIKYALEKKLPVVICTTGLSPETLELLDKASSEIPVFRSANMSIGINLICSILKKYAPVLREAGFDIEILERHHNFKLDAPSGTALLLADSINESMDSKFNYVYDRSAYRKQRDKNEIGISAMRGGTIVGEHTVMFAGRNEVIEFNHSAHSKDVFAVGAVKAAKFMTGREKGKYDMQSVMSEL
ncbi:MAG: 4-hydroxy-tetrahydrodipicolinate reductase [Clostridiales bacterium]|nr:4-hydroxy-tetrahydrodipicolinate reductase [Clostridiales bacterium]